MPFISVTRLRVRAFRFLPAFALQTLRALGQVKAASGFRSGSLLPDRAFTFWTLTAWDDQASMRASIMSGSHRAAMPLLVGWCDEASVVHWDQPDDILPAWTEADRRMRQEGRATTVKFPSSRHASLTYRTPRVSRARPIHPVLKGPQPITAPVRAAVPEASVGQDEAARGGCARPPLR